MIGLLQEHTIGKGVAEQGGSHPDATNQDNSHRPAANVQSNGQSESHESDQGNRHSEMKKQERVTSEGRVDQGSSHTQVNQLQQQLATGSKQLEALVKVKKCA